MLPAACLSPSSSVLGTVALRIKGDSRSVVRPVLAEGLCAQSDYVRALVRGGFAESHRDNNRPIDIVLPDGLMAAADLDDLADLVSGDADDTLDIRTAIGLWRVFDFLALDDLHKRAHHLIEKGLDFWSCTNDRTAVIDPVDLFALYKLRLETVDNATQPPDPRATLFDPRALWHHVGCADMPLDGSPCKTRFDRLHSFIALGPTLVDVATTALDDLTTVDNDCRRPVECVVAMSHAITAALADYHRCTAPIGEHIERGRDRAVCNVFGSNLARRLVVAQGRHTGEPCFVPNIDSFREGLIDDFPRLAPVLFGSRWLGDGVTLAGGSVVNAMQSRPLRASLAQSDLDLWVTGWSRSSRKRTFKRIVRHIFASMPGCRGKIDEACAVTITVAPPVCDTDMQLDQRSPNTQRAESVQVILTDYDHPSEIASEFDLDHACALFDGRNVHASWGCVASMVSRTTRAVSGTETRPLRIAKAHQKGFDFVRAPPDTDDKCDDDNARGLSPIVQDDGNERYGLEADIFRRPTKRERMGDGYYDDADDLLRAFCFAPLVVGSARSRPPRSRPTHVGSTRIVWARRPVFLRLPPSRVLSVCCVVCANDQTRSKRDSSCDHKPTGLSLLIDDSVDGTAMDIVEAERALFTMIASKHHIFTDRTLGNDMARAARTSAAAVAQNVAANWVSLIFRASDARRTVLDPNPRTEARIHIQCGPDETQVRDAITGRLLDLSTIAAGSYVSGRVVADRVVVNYGFRPRLLGLTLCVYPPTMPCILSSMGRP
jgi:hypothetical protein